MLKTPKNNLIDDLVVSYRSGDMNSGLELIESFRSLIGKYVNVFLKGEYKESDKDIVVFLQSFGSFDISLVAGLIRKRLRIYSANEIIGLCRASILLTAKSYLNISGSYKLVLKEQLNLILREDFPEGSPPIVPTEEDLLGKNAGYKSSKVYKSLNVLEKRVIEEILINKSNVKKFLLKEGLTPSQYNTLVEDIKSKATKFLS